MYIYIYYLFSFYVYIGVQTPWNMFSVSSTPGTLIPCGRSAAVAVFCVLAEMRGMLFAVDEFWICRILDVSDMSDTRSTSGDMTDTGYRICRMSDTGSTKCPKSQS